MSVFVKNGSGADFTGRFDGHDWVIPDGAIVEFPTDAASHILGYGIADKSDLFVRLGWMRSTSEINSAYEKLNKFSFFASREDAENSGGAASGDAATELPAPVSAAAPEPSALVSDGEGQQADYAHKRKRKPNLLNKLAQITQE